ncbi:hypothetical protein EJ04DRAFT_507772 [Polyplosphaeria fusca]|uniref:Fe2OG dioxygenase domain-containing protein n=1 Tax=Polyplosphaeria fusca TaxID=682080 RepID=A0A9P4RBZ2_9PLEO|nr:hypothetical protein EJ04DRAFT_507772 [Polyplosphaeria fusca]
MALITNAFLFGLGVLLPLTFGPITHADLSFATFFPLWEPKPATSRPTQVLSVSPLLLAIPGFLAPSEIDHLLSLGEPLFSRSTTGTKGQISSGRTSSSCFLPANDTIVRRVKERAADVLGGIQYDGLEALQLVRYTENQRVNLHYDWYKNRLPLDRKDRPYNRIASFFVYLQTDCEGGETWFPNVTIPVADIERVKGTWDVGESLNVGSDGAGVKIKLKAGSGLFWVNMQDGAGDRRTLHAGLPVERGVKVGMNIWVKMLVT